LRNSNPPINIKSQERWAFWDRSSKIRGSKFKVVIKRMEREKNINKNSERDKTRHLDS